MLVAGHHDPPPGRPLEAPPTDVRAVTRVRLRGGGTPVRHARP